MSSIHTPTLSAHTPDPAKAAKEREAAIEAGTRNLHPVFDRIVVVPDSAESSTASGLIIPQNARVKTWRGTVVARGAGKQLENGATGKIAAHVGHSVLYEQYAGQDIEFDGHSYTIIRDSDVLAIVGGSADARDLS